MNIVVAGGAGFIGSAFVRRRLAQTADRLVVLDKLTYAGSRANLATVEADRATAPRFRFVEGDIADARVVGPLVAEADAVVNFAAESHVDRSILDAEAFLRTGVIGVHVLLEAVRRRQAVSSCRFLQVSTDEIYGPLETGYSREDDPPNPRSPYAAAKAAGEMLARAYATTHGLDVIITRGANTYGPYQHPEKLIPLFITNAIADEPLPLYGDGLQERDWIFVDDHADAVGFVLDHGAPGEAYNVPGASSRTNREVTEHILAELGKPWDLVRSVRDRPGHDRRYAMDGSKLQALGWRCRVPFEEGLPATIRWFAANRDWWTAAKSGEWHDYYRRQYAHRLAESVRA
ncbi:MAG: dTDP-glucose 4,6-dehydratase [Chloroflexota bacterium]|nr:dTDP-glucose 4,6-dehydratase [Chloroflexota bacterium]